MNSIFHYTASLYKSFIVFVITALFVVCMLGIGIALLFTALAAPMGIADDTGTWSYLLLYIFAPPVFYIGMYCMQIGFSTLDVD